MRNIREQKHCVDCGKEIYYTSSRCQSCNIRRYNATEDNKIFSQEHRRKLSMSSKGRKFSEEYKKRKSETMKMLYATGKRIPSNLGKKMSKEIREKMSISKKGIKHSESWKLNMSKAMQGRLFSDEHKKRISLAKKGTIVSEETKKKLSIAGKGRVFTDEHKRKISLSHIGKQKPWNTGANNYWYGKKRPEIALRNKMMDMRMEKNPNWQGGISFEPYPITFNKEFKSIVRLRDNFCCLNCGISEQKHIILRGSKLVVHHINYIKSETNLFNCCTICHNCNLLANTKREEWKLYYQNKLSERYGYKYDSEGSVIVELNPLEVKNEIK